MPPAYKPLTSGIPGLSADLFTEAPVSYEDVQKQNAALLAQRLANQSNQMAINEKQRILEQEAQQREALKSQFGGTETFDPSAALQIAQKIAIQNGDLDSALQIEKVSRERANTFQPYDETQRQLLSKEFGYDLPEGISPAFIRDLGSIRGRNLYGESIQFGKDRWKDQQESLVPEGWEGNPTVDDSKKFKTTLIATNKVNGILDALKDSLSRTGTEAATGADYVLQRQLVGDLALELKSPAFGNLGAALSPSEYQLLLTQLPALLASPETSLGRVLVERGMGRDPLVAIEAIRAKIQRNLEIEAPIRNMRRKVVGDPAQGADRGADQGAARGPVVPNGQFMGNDPATGLPIYLRPR